MTGPQEVVLSGDTSFESIMHKKTAQTDVGFSAMLKKDKEAQRAAVDDYFQHWNSKKADNETEADRTTRTHDYASITRQYYNLATDFYEYGWSQSFHFCRFGPRDLSFHQALARHEHYLAHTLHLHPRDRVLDLGSGVGGPARAIASFTGAHVTGITLNPYQATRATRYAAQDGLGKQCEFITGDFMALPFEEGAFDAVYAIEATVHAPSLEGVYRQAYRVLKPGGKFGVYEWVLTDAYDDTNAQHRWIRRAIEEGDGIARLVGQKEALEAMRAAGFEVLETEDLAERWVGDGVEGSDVAPWYWPLDGEGWRYARSVSDLVKTFRMTPWGRWMAHGFMGALETLRLAPPGTKQTGDSLARAAEALVLGGKLKLFTPMFLMVGRKPLDAGDFISTE